MTTQMKSRSFINSEHNDVNILSQLDHTTSIIRSFPGSFPEPESPQNLQHFKKEQRKVFLLTSNCFFHRRVQKSASLALSFLIKLGHKRRQQEVCVNNALITIPSTLPEAA